ncbi:MAG TPA: shikimate dehydrogenase [Acidimicrobiales bacterium]|nr:shikimate dehydrogenase [Acidimicrobiales bacterium]
MTGGPVERRSPRWPSAASSVVGVIGDPVRHSLSPLLHNAAFDALGLDWVSVAFPVAAGRVADALAGMRALDIVGLSVTMPHKQDAAALVDERTAVAQRLGVVNCVTQTGGRLVGDSTDGAGFVEALRRSVGFDPAGRRCVVVGAGGAARAVVLALAGAGALEVVVVNRTPARATEAAALAGGCGRVGSEADVGGAELVVQATPVGMAAGGTPPAGQPASDARSVPFDPALLHKGQVVADIVYHPAVTPLLAAARSRGVETVGGLGMLVHQAGLAIERWTGQPAPVEAMWAAARQERAAAGGR